MRQSVPRTLHTARPFAGTVPENLEQHHKETKTVPQSHAVSCFLILALSYGYLSLVGLINRALYTAVTIVPAGQGAFGHASGSTVLVGSSPAWVHRHSLLPTFC